MSNSGIDPSAACALLAARARAKGEETTTEHQRHTGQTLYLFGEEKRHEEAPAAIEEPPVLVSQTTTGSSTREVVGVVFEAQRDRVDAFRAFDSALAKAVETNSLNDYGAAVQRATKRFDAVSTRINNCESELRKRNAIVADCVRQLQDAEKDHLELTAASHLAALRMEDTNDLDHKLSKTIQQVNDALDALRMETDDYE